MKIMLLILFSLSLLNAELNYWPQPGANSRHISHFDLDGPHEKPEIAWTYKIECSNPNHLHIGGVVTDTLGNSYITAYPDENAIYSIFLSLDMNGEVRWKKEYKDNPWFSSPIIDLNKNRIYLSSTHYTMHLGAYDFDGNQLWTTTMCGMPVLGENGILYLSSDAYYALDSDGNILWQTEKLDEIAGFLPAVDTDGTSYVMGDGILYRISNQGQVDWNVYLSHEWNEYLSYSVCIGDSTIYLCWNKDLVCKRKSDGSDKWRYGLDYSSEWDHEKDFPILTSNKNILIKEYATSTEYLYSLDENGNLVFKSLVGKDYIFPTGIPIEDKSGLLFLETRCLDKSGNTIWNVEDLLESTFGGKIAFDKYGRIVVACYMRYSYDRFSVFCLRSTNKFSNKSSSSSLPSPSLSVYPNPFSSRLSISLPSSGAIYSITGQLIMNLSKGKHSLDTSSWREGVYIVKSGKEIKRMIKIN